MTAKRTKKKADQAIELSMPSDLWEFYEAVARLSHVPFDGVIAVELAMRIVEEKDSLWGRKKQP